MTGDILIIRCGECGTKFRFPVPEKAPAEILLKCSACGTVFSFALPPPRPPRKPVPKMIDLSLLEMSPAGGERKQRAFLPPAGTRPARRPGVRRALHRFLVLTLAAGIAACAVFFWQNPEWLESPPDPPIDPVEKVQIGNLQQRFLLNTTLGRLRIIEGTATNEAEYPLERIRMLGKLYDERSNLLAVQTASCGRIVPDEQLGAASDQDLIAARDGTGPWESASPRVSERVPPKGRIPFMIVFYGEPAGVTQAYVVAISARKAD